MADHWIGHFLSPWSSFPINILLIYNLIWYNNIQWVFRICHMNWVPVFVLIFSFLFPLVIAHAEEKMVIGRVEDVILLPWGVKLPARIDTGAAKSSLDAQELTIQDNMAEFRLPQKYGGLKLRLPIIEWRHIRTPDGRQRRPIVELEFCIGSKRIRNKVNLTDRSLVKYPLILGRNFLRDHFVVDVKRSRTVRPNCSDIPKQ